MPLHHARSWGLHHADRPPCWFAEVVLFVQFTVPTVVMEGGRRASRRDSKHGGAWSTAARAGSAWARSGELCSAKLGFGHTESHCSARCEDGEKGKRGAGGGADIYCSWGGDDRVWAGLFKVCCIAAIHLKNQRVREYGLVWAELGIILRPIIVWSDFFKKKNYERQINF